MFQNLDHIFDYLCVPGDWFCWVKFYIEKCTLEGKKKIKNI